MNRMLLNKDGLFVSSPGQNVLTANEMLLNFSSSVRASKVILNITGTSSLVGSNHEWSYNLGNNYVSSYPLILASCRFTSGTDQRWYHIGVGCWRVTSFVPPFRFQIVPRFNVFLRKNSSNNFTLSAILDQNSNTTFPFIVKAFIMDNGAGTW